MKLTTLINQKDHLSASFATICWPQRLRSLSGTAFDPSACKNAYCFCRSARLSLLFSLIRVDPHPQRRRFLHYVAVVYVILCILLVFQLVWICQAQPHWKTRPVPQCHLGWQIALFQLISTSFSPSQNLLRGFAKSHHSADVVADSSLLITPLLQFRIITDKPLRTRLGVIFSTCIITTVASLVHAVFILTSSGVQVEIAGIMEVRVDHRLGPPISHFWAELRVACGMQYTSYRLGLVTTTIIKFTTLINDFVIDHHVSLKRRVARTSRQPPSWITRSPCPFFPRHPPHADPPPLL